MKLFRLTRDSLRTGQPLVVFVRAKDKLEARKLAAKQDGPDWLRLGLVTCEEISADAPSEVLGFYTESER